MSISTSPSTQDAKVAVRVCTRDTPTEVCKQSLRRIKDMRPEWNLGIVRNKYSVAMNRAAAVRNAREEKYDFLLMLDDDVGPLDSVVNLPAHDQPVVGGLVPTWRDGLFFWNAFHLQEDAALMHSVLARGPQGGLEEVYAVGTAILCIRRDVFMDESLDPLFEFALRPDGTMAHILGGEDVVFCRKMHERGIPVLIDHAVQGEHYTKINFLETLVQGKKYAAHHPDHGFPSVFAFDLSGLSRDQLRHADAYLARRRERKERLVGGNREPVPEPELQILE